MLSRMPPRRKCNTDESWKKSGGGFGPIKKGNRRLGIVIPPKPGRLKSGDRAALEVKKYQKDGGHLIPRAPFNRLAREIFEKVAQENVTEECTAVKKAKGTEAAELAKRTKVTRIEKSAFEPLQMAAEQHISVIFNSGFFFN